MIVDREPGGLDAPGVCRALKADPRLEDAWLLAITVAAHKRTADAALDAGADDYLHRPFSRAELLARARAGLRAAQQRADDALVRALMANVPGAIYRSAWHADYTLELISDEIERISGYPAANFIASKRRTLFSILHPDDREQVRTAIDRASGRRAVRARVPDRPRRRRDPLGARPRPPRLGRRRARVVRRRDLRHHRAPRRRGGAAPARDRARPHRGDASVARAHHRRRRHRPAQDRARPARRRPAAPRRDGARGADGALPRREGPGRRGTVPRAPRRRAVRGVGRAARAGPRHPPRRADRARPRAGDLGAGRPRAGAGRDRRAAGDPVRRPPPRRRPTSRSPRR